MIKHMLRKPLGFGLSLLGKQRVVALISRLTGFAAARLSTDEALRFLFDLEWRLYSLQGQLAIKYGNGLHTKHRHTRYHDFFIGRISESEKVIDIGCGNGALAWDIATSCQAHVTAIDYNEENIRVAERNFNAPNVDFVQGDALSDLPNIHFDVVVLSNVLEHIEDRIGFLVGIKGSLSPDRFLIRVPLFERDWRVPLKKELGVEWRLDPTHFVEYTFESFLREADLADLQVTHIETRWGEIWSELCPKSS